MFTYINDEPIEAGAISSTIMFGNRTVGRCIHDFRGNDTYYIPDVDAKLEGEGSESLAKGCLFFAKYKAFVDEGEAYKYVQDNFSQVAYLMQFGDFD